MKHGNGSFIFLFYVFIKYHFIYYHYPRDKKKFLNVALCNFQIIDLLSLSKKPLT